MLIFIENTPRAYAWGSRDALPALLGTTPTGEPQAELWLGDHPGAPASVAKASPAPQTLIDLIESDPERYGVDGRHLPFLMKVLGIGAPLSLQVHPDKRQAEEGFAREEALGIARDARVRNYGDANHKPELLVALSEVTALCGFRPLAEARADLLALAAAAPVGPGREVLRRAAEHCLLVRGDGRAGEGEAGAREASAREAGAAGEREARSSYLNWVLGGDEAVAAGVRAIAQALPRMAEGGDPQGSMVPTIPAISADRLRSLIELTQTHPADPGVLISLLLHLVTLRPGEAIYLSARQLHAYLGGIAVEVMAASDNVLRAGFTEKHIDVDEVLRIVDLATLDSPRIHARRLAPGLVQWSPGVPEFTLLRARLGDPDAGEVAAEAAVAAVAAQPGQAEARPVADLPDSELVSSAMSDEDRAASVVVRVPYPTVLVVVSGRVRVERVGGELAEVASVARGQSLYVSAGEDIELTGVAEVFLSTVGDSWSRVSQPSSSD